MSFISYFLLGILQGVGEFLPISSSGHLILLKQFINLPQNLYLDVVLHLATLLAVLLYFKKDIFFILVDIKNDVLSFFKTKSLNISKNSYLALYILFACVPTFVLGFIFKDYFEGFRDTNTVLIMLTLISFFMLLDVFSVKIINSPKLNFTKAFIIGLFQTIALLPGSSRSGVTITTAKLLGISSKKAIRFSFLLSIPAILAAFVFSLGDIQNVSQLINLSTFIAFITSFVFGFLSIRFLISVFNKFGLTPFIIYRLLLVVFVLIISL